MSENTNTKEGAIVTGRSLEDYGFYLRFEKQLLQGQSVLNVGCGGSNLQKNIKGLSDTRIKNIDILHDPYAGWVSNPFGFIAARFIQRYFPQKVQLRRELAGIANRSIIQGDAKKLPFADDSFDISLALLSLYQIPKDQRFEAYKEMVRVTKKAIHIFPIFQVDIPGLVEMQNISDCTILYLDELPNFFTEHPSLKIENENDYIAYYNGERRLYMPRQEDVIYGRSVLSLGHLAANFEGGHSIIICKDDFLNQSTKKRLSY